MMQRHWHTVARSSFPWEQEALDFVRRALPDSDLYRAWANFEIVTSDGRIYEIDLLVISPAGVFLVEAKSWKGRVEGDAAAWTLSSPEHRTRTVRNPRLLANHKAKVLKSLIVTQKGAPKRFFIEPVIFLSDPDVRIQLDDRARQGVYLRDREATPARPGRPGLIRALTEPQRSRLDRPTIEKIASALERAGVRRFKRQDRIGSYRLVETLHETATYQEWLVAKVDFPDVRRRLRLYPVGRTTDAETRERMVRAARREFEFLHDLAHDAIDRADDYDEDDRGPYLLFRQRKDTRRLDRYLADWGERLGPRERLALLRQLFEVLAFAHDHELVHRALSPAVIEVSGPPAAPRVVVGDWSAGRRQLETRRLSATEHVEARVDDDGRLYLAPELLAGRPIQAYDEKALDIFSLGVLAYLVLTGSAPAADEVELRRHLEESQGLRLASVVDGAVSSLQELVFEATRPDVANRSRSVEEMLTWLDIAEDELGVAEPTAGFSDPLELKVGDTLPGGLEIRKVLGSGATARVFEVSKGESEESERMVLKLALRRELAERIRDEYEVLMRLRHPNIVAAHELVEASGHLGILMQSAGKTTVARALVQDPFDPGELKKLGEELLRVIDHLEEMGLAHRDLKPANLGLLETARRRRRLTVFDFSLSRVSAEKVRAGTVPYLDPFLQRAGKHGQVRDRWDVHAERYAAAVTLYEMASRRRLVWGDGRSDPALLPDPEPAIDRSDFIELDESTAEGLVAFFRRAFEPEIRDRFDTCEQMLAAWLAVFDAAAGPAAAAESETASPSLPGPPSARGPDPNAPPFDASAVESASLETALDTLGLPGRPRLALQRAGASTVGDVLALDVQPVLEQPSVGTKTRGQVLELVAALRGRFPQAPEPAPVAVEEDEEDPATASLDAIFERLLATRGKKRVGSELVQRLLAGDSELGPWPSQTELALAAQVSRQAVHQAVARARRRWRQDSRLESLRLDVASLLARRALVMSLDELVDAVLYRRGSRAGGSERRRRALAVTRAVVETESSRRGSRFAAFRRDRRIFIACTSVAELELPIGLSIDAEALDAGSEIGPALVAWAQRLGAEADRLAELDPLASPRRVRERLAAVPSPLTVDALDPERLAQLAAAASERAALSPRGELYPRDLPAARAVLLARGALLGVARSLRPEQVHERVRSRFPEGEPLPGRPALDRLLEDAEAGLEWDGVRQLYRPRPTGLVLTSSESSEGRPAVEIDAGRFARRLSRAQARGDFLFLTAAPARVEALPAMLAEHYALDVRSIERGLLEALRDACREHGVEWDVVLSADDRSDADQWRELLHFIRHHALPRFEASLEDAGSTLLLTRPGLLGRYGLLSFFDRLRARCGADLGAWVLVPSGDPTARPRLDGHALPILGAGEHVPVPDAWPAGG